ncbi:MAG: hypothetical protein H0X26_05235 [Alphaproteobacteria bacterium]|nr:hypothetical protein [Alphaproteobacteria bacterium]
MLIEIKGKLSSADLYKLVEILSSYFQKKGVEEFVDIDIGLKPFSKSIQLPASISDDEGREVRSIKITKSKLGELELRENSVDNTWMTTPLGTFSPGELVMRVWPLYLTGFGLLMFYLIWHWFFKEI